MTTHLRIPGDPDEPSGAWSRWSTEVEIRGTWQGTGPAPPAPHPLLHHVLRKIRSPRLHQPPPPVPWHLNAGCEPSPSPRMGSVWLAPTAGGHDSDRSVPQPCACRCKGTWRWRSTQHSSSAQQIVLERPCTYLHLKLVMRSKRILIQNSVQMSTKLYIFWLQLPQVRRSLPQPLIPAS